MKNSLKKAMKNSFFKRGVLNLYYNVDHITFRDYFINHYKHC